MITRTFIREQPAMSKESKTSYYELTDKDLSNTVGGAVSDYLKLDGIKGESKEDKHKDWIEIGSF